MKIIACKHLLNHDLYPIDEPRNRLRASVVKATRAALAEDGCAVIRNFFSKQGLAALLAEGVDRKAKAYYSENKACNVYLGDGNPERPDDHPQNIFLERTNGFISADWYAEDTVSHRLYYWPPMKKFMADCLEKEELFIYEDPVSNMIVNVGTPGSRFNWHFDTNEFTITMLLKATSSGGYFEYAPNIRNARDECHDAVSEVLGGTRDRVKRLDLQPGDLQLFQGRFSLHQVTENTGHDDRLLLIMSFAEEPEMVGSKERVQQLYGKTTDVHENQQARTDGLRD